MRNNRKHAREKLLFRYSSALQQGDFTTLAAILAEAERDPVLARQLAELDAAYAVEPTFSLNGHRKETPVSAYVQAAPIVRARRFNPTFAYAAAILVVVLFGTLVFANRPNGTNDDANAALPLLQSTETATPAPLVTATPFPTPTLSPFASTVVPPNGDRAALPQIGSPVMPLICAGQTNAETVTELRSLPTLLQGIVVAYVPINTPLSVVDVYQADTEGWYYVVTDQGGLRTQGWSPANALIVNAECQYQYSENNGVVTITYIVQPGDTLLSIASQFGLGIPDLPRLLEINDLSEDTLLTPGQTLLIEVPSNRPGNLNFDRSDAVMTMMPTVVPPLDTMLQTATAILQQATGTAGALMGDQGANRQGEVEQTATAIIIEATARAATPTSTPIGQ